MAADVLGVKPRARTGQLRSGMPIVELFAFYRGSAARPNCSLANANQARIKLAGLKSLRHSSIFVQSPISGNDTGVGVSWSSTVYSSCNMPLADAAAAVEPLGELVTCSIVARAPTSHDMDQ